MSSLVLELQVEAMDPNIRITDLLRKVKFVAAKLGVDDILEWTNHELNGYPEDEDQIPEYRRIRGVAKAFNNLYQRWQKIEFEDHTLEDRVSTQKSNQPISEIEQMAQGADGSLTFIVSSAFALGELSHGSDPRIFVANSQIVRILDAVRNRVQDWSLDLEKRGIMGEGMSFTPEEKQRAAEAHYTTSITNNYTISGSNVGIAGPVTADSIVQNIGPSMDELLAALASLKEAASDAGSAEVVSATDDAVVAASSGGGLSVVERALILVAATVQGIASLGPAWLAVTTEAAKLGIKSLTGGH